MKRPKAAVLPALLWLPVLTAGGLAAATGATPNRELVFPKDAGLIDVTAPPFRADNTGKTPADPAIQAAISDAMSSHRSIYLPAGTYLVTRPLLWIDAKGTWGAGVELIGENSTRTVLRLRDGSPAFAKPCNANTWRQAVIVTGGYGAGPYRPDGGSNGATNNSFFNYIWNLTIDTGTNNPCATGIDWSANNLASIRDVTVRSEDYGVSSAFAGIATDRDYFGPALIKNVTIAGFRYGIFDNHSLADLTVVNLVVSGQSASGVFLGGSQCGLAVENLVSVNAVPAIRVSALATLLTVVGAQLTGNGRGAGTQSAIQIATATPDPKHPSTPPAFYLRGIRTSGYQSALAVGNDGGALAAMQGESIAEFANTAALNLGTRDQAAKVLPGSPATALKLRIQDYAEWSDTNLAHWVNPQKICGAGCRPDSRHDYADAIQRAIDTPGATTVYLPPGQYAISHPVHIRGAVRRLIGFGDATVVPLANFVPERNPGALVIDNSAAGPVSIEHLRLGENTTAGNLDFPFPTISDASRNPLVIRDSGNFSYQNQPGAGDLYLEDVTCLARDVPQPRIPYCFSFNSQRVWARQLDPEVNESAASHASAKVYNNGGAAWILDLKTEGNYSPAILTAGGGQTELLGGVMFPNGGPNDPRFPIFVNRASSHSLVFRTNGEGTPSGYFPVQVVEEPGGGQAPLTFKTLNVPAQYGSWGTNTFMPLYTGYRPGAAKK